MRSIGLGGRLAAVAAIAMASAGVGPVVVSAAGDAPPPRPRPKRRVVARPKFGGFDPRMNRWTGKPHEHKREIARRLRQAQS